MGYSEQEPVAKTWEAVQIPNSYIIDCGASAGHFNHIYISS